MIETGSRAPTIPSAAPICADTFATIAEPWLLPAFAW